MVTAHDTIFDVISDVTNRTEPFHSEVLGWFLRNDDDFLKRFLTAFVPADYSERHGFAVAPVSEIIVENEDRQATGDRIDLTIRHGQAIIGIEVKTTDASAACEQLNRYWTLLSEKYQGSELYLLYVTPFNQDNCPAGIPSERIGAITEFSRFCRDHPSRGRHLNWTQITVLYPQEGPSPNLESIYCQHRQFVEQDICNPELDRCVNNTRELSEFFGKECVRRFFETLKRGDDPVEIQENEHYYVIPLHVNHTRYQQILDAILVLLDSDCLNKNGLAPKHTERPDIKQQYETGQFGPFFQRLFRYVEPLCYVWLEGEGNLGLRVKHPGYRSNGVSVVTLLPDGLQIRKKR